MTCKTKKREEGKHEERTKRTQEEKDKT